MNAIFSDHVDLLKIIVSLLVNNLRLIVKNVYLKALYSIQIRTYEAYINEFMYTLKCIFALNCL